jgi:hypothetical protein
MKRLAFAALAFAALATASSAQSVERSIDLTQLGWGHVTATPVDIDGDRLTEEWLVEQTATGLYRVVAVRAGGLCLGAWFNPRPPATFTAVVLGRLAGRDVLLVRNSFASVLTVVTLDTPACQ